MINLLMCDLDIFMIVVVLANEYISFLDDFCQVLIYDTISNQDTQHTLLPVFVKLSFATGDFEQSNTFIFPTFISSVCRAVDHSINLYNYLQLRTHITFRWLGSVLVT